MTSEKPLLRQQALIGGEWCDADSGGRIEVTDPATGKILGAVPNMRVTEAMRAIAAAQRALSAWSGRTAKDRAGILRRWFDLVMSHQEELARLLTAEQGKPLAEARGEIAYAASFIEWFAEEGKRIYGDLIPPHGTDKRILVLKQPIGVVAAITPWNFPAAMVTRKLAPALAAGCTAVLKPSELTPLSALALAMLAERAGMPPGVLNVVTGEAEAIGRVFCSSPLVRKLSFTGSTEVGMILLRQAAETVKKCAMELGGNAPFIVFEDADLDRAVAGAIASKFRNAGQTCVCANRFLVQDSVYDRFAERLVAAVKTLKVGNGAVDGVAIGPLIEPAAIAKVECHIGDALGKGAKLLHGGNRHALGGNFFEPTVIGEIRRDMLICEEETFGPVAGLMRFTTEADAVTLANDTQYGLAAYFYTRDMARLMRVAERLEYGIVGINEGIISTEVAPFGGMKQSGIGREGSKYGIDDFLEIKYLCLGGVDTTREE